MEVLSVYLHDLSCGKYTLERWFADITDDIGKPMVDIGYEQCKEYFEHFKSSLGLRGSVKIYSAED